MQVAGFRLQYDVTKPIGQRVHSAKALCNTCPDFWYVELQDDEVTLLGHSCICFGSRFEALRTASIWFALVMHSASIHTFVFGG